MHIVSDSANVDVEQVETSEATINVDVTVTKAAGIPAPGVGYEQGPGAVNVDVEQVETSEATVTAAVGITAPGVRDEQGPQAINVDVEQVGTVENVDNVDTGGTLVSRVRRKFNTLSPTITDSDLDYDSWKRRRESLGRKGELPGDERVERQAQEDGGEKVWKKRRLSSVPETGLTLKPNINTNQYYSSVWGGQEAGVHSEDGAGGGNGGGVHPANTDYGQQYTRTVGNFFHICRPAEQCSCYSGKTGSEGKAQYKNRA